MPTNHQIKWAGSSAFPWNSLLLCQFWCRQFNLKVLPRNILKGCEDSINKIDDPNLTQQFHMKLPAPEPLLAEHWKRHVTSLGSMVHSYMNHNTLREQCSDARYFTQNTQLANILYSELHSGSPTLKARTLTHKPYVLPTIHTLLHKNFTSCELLCLFHTANYVLQICK